MPSHASRQRRLAEQLASSRAAAEERRERFAAAEAAGKEPQRTEADLNYGFGV